jgi:transcription initiation factor TFIID TATA-box-binding protein
VNSYPEAEYRPDQFPGLVFRLKRPKTATLIFGSGKMICTGAKSGKESRRAIMKAVNELIMGGIIIVSKPDLKVVNIVASASLGGNSPRVFLVDVLYSCFSLGF